MIIMAVLFSRKLQTPTNAFVTSLSVSDFLCSFFLIWFIVGVLGKNGWPLPEANWICAATGFMIYASLGTSLYTLGAISLNRLIGITRPFLCRRIFSSWKLFIMVIIPWIIPCGSLAVAVATDTVVLGYDPTDFTCSYLQSHVKSDVFSFWQIIVAFPIPVLTIVGSYLWIYIFLKRHYTEQKKRFQIPVTSGQRLYDHGQDGDCTTATTERIHNLSNTNIVSLDRRRKISQQQIKITKNLFLVVCAFFACFLPFFAFILVPNNIRLMLYARVPALASCAINFVIYAWKHPDFKIVLGHLIQRSYADIPQPSRLLKFLLSKKNNI